LPAKASIEALAAAGALLLLRLYQPAEALWCPFRYLFGIPCPLCGMTRALAALTRWEWRQALELNVLSPAAFAVLAALALGLRPPVRVWQGLAAALALLAAVRVAAHTL
jgi:hypothetical protein